MGVGLKKDGQKNRDNLSGINNLLYQHVVEIVGFHLIKYSKAKDEDCPLNVMIQGSSIIWDEG